MLIFILDVELAFIIGKSLLLSNFLQRSCSAR
jgi:hypothetical protein